MNLSDLTAVSTPADMQTWLAQNCVTPISPVMTGSDLGTILQKMINISPVAPQVNFDAIPTNGSNNAVTSTGIKSYVDGQVSSVKGSIFNTEPSGGWQIGDIWLVNDNNGQLQEIRKITNNLQGWQNYPSFQPLNDFSVFAPVYNVIAPFDSNGQDGTYCWMAAFEPYEGSVYLPKNGDIWAEFFYKENGHWQSVLQIVCSTNPYGNGHTTDQDGVIDGNGDRIAMYTYNGGPAILKYFELQYDVIATAAGGTGANFANTNLTFTDNRIHDADGKSLAINNLHAVKFDGNFLFVANSNGQPMLAFKNDHGETPDTNAGAMICGSAEGGAIVLRNTTGGDDASLELGQIDDWQGNFESFMSMINHTVVAHNPVSTEKGIIFVVQATDPVVADIPDGTFKAFKNSTSGDLKLWANDNGTLKSIAFL